MTTSSNSPNTAELSSTYVTLNPVGVRISTAEVFRQVEQLDQLVESLVIGQDWDNDVRLVLFVVVREGLRRYARR